MTFELSAEQQAARDAAQAFAQDRLAAVASGIDVSGVIPADLLRELQAIAAPARGDAVALAAVVEELATASAAAAAAAALGIAEADDEAAGLRGFSPSRAADTRARLVMAAVSLGIGRAAVEDALHRLRESGRQSQDQEKPHWAVADAATDVAAARLLTLRAAQLLAPLDAARGGPAGVAGPDDTAAGGAVAMAKLAAARAAQQAVDVALRIAGPAGFARGLLLERLTRDARAAALGLGSDEDLRAAAANAVLPG